MLRVVDGGCSSRFAGLEVDPDGRAVAYATPQNNSGFTDHLLAWHSGFLDNGAVVARPG